MDVEALSRFRAMKDDFFATDPTSPLTPPQRARFRGLAYFAPNPELVVEAEFRASVAPDEVDLVTSCGDTERYRRAGVARFEVAGVRAAITLFRSDRGELFVPFRDATSGTETYGAGRYLEARSLGDGRTLLDFNYAYNPYCAYGTGWRCPLPPVENHLAVPIRAGEMRHRDAEPPRPRRRMKPGIVAHLRRPSRARAWDAFVSRRRGGGEMRPFGVPRGLVLVGALALALGACSSGNGDGSAEGAAPTGNDNPTSADGCAGAAGLTGAIEDRGTAEAARGAVTLDASEFAFSPTCVEAAAGETLEVTVTNTGSALHNLTVESLEIDEDVQAGQTITVQVTLPDSGSVPFVCKYHVSNGMQGAFLIG